MTLRGFQYEQQINQTVGHLFVKRPVSRCDSGRFAVRNGPFWLAKWAVLQRDLC